MPLIAIDGAQGEGGGQILRTALTLSAVTGRGFEIRQIRAGRVRPGLRPQHVAAVRAAAMACGARVGGVFEGSPDLRFEPGPVTPGQFRFEIATAGAATLVLQTVLPVLASASECSQVEVTGGTHVPTSPSFDYLARHWRAVVERTGLQSSVTLRRAGFFPRGGGELLAEVQPWNRPGAPVSLEDRGELVGFRGVSGAGRLKGDVAQRQRDGAAEQLWEHRRQQAAWEVLDVPAASPGSFLLIEAVFSNGRVALGFLGRRDVKPENLGARSVRVLLKLLAGEGAVDPRLADQLAVPLALSGVGGQVSTLQVTRHLETVTDILSAFGIPSRTWGRCGGPGGLDVGRS